MRKSMSMTLGGLALVASASVAADYPERDVRMIVPWGAGGGTDGIVRKISNLAEEPLGGTVYVENIEGGMSANGLVQALGARPDGYTLIALTYDSVVTIPWQGMLAGYDIDKLDLIARITSEPDAVVVPEDSRFDSLEALIEAAKAAPGEIRAGIQNMGSRTHLTLLQLQDQAEVEFKIVSYPGGAAPQKEALLNGEVDLALTSLGDFESLISAGDARGLVEFTDVQSESFPDVPPATELGYDIQMGSFVILAAPANTPDDAVTALEAAYQQAYDSEEFQTWLVDVGVTPNWLGTDEVEDWAEQTQGELFARMDELKEAGLIGQ
ncbi:MULTISPECIES: tripartite tricarboxylate transporter substrate binding protein [unclassified Halomonas]|uniref:Bug family tripartite tricarboxylate transporter substrate binding protein n=1 Tax=unclassified Halomonas TaxID=2609666 RepID=UPI001C99FB8B|nr:MULTISPECIES: tripartite tricarboxylate transporter substrate binding protein [unclassified Halomonas]MBY5940746.1 tripartite tricarboxylate transporter substrate binding protein [Halomonas sp. DP5N14-9]MCJ8285215.1 tripartite tricarboxylate transporter substrate binding protein [Halomonas sp.]|tara:strand:- start:1 stop:972 length:972 start_codon:yes stop_codon:yes gene_type:complete